MLMQVVLTVAESKRLIAKGVAAHPVVRRALQEGTVVIARGSTNGCVAQEILGEPLDKLAFLTGHTLPRGHKGSRPRPEGIPEIVVREGKVVPGISLAEAVADLKAGDVVIKGANALDYDRRVVGILVGHPEGGTIGAVLPTVIARKAHLVTPVGLEKLVASDLTATSRLIAEGALDAEPVPALWVLDAAVIVTEIEALELTAGVSCRHLASGGIGGAEGSVRLLISGDRESVDEARRLLDSIAGEPPFAI